MSKASKSVAPQSCLVSPPEEALRVMISRMSPVGDAVLTLPVACALRDHYPNAFISWVVEKAAAPMVHGHRAVDEVIVLESGWFRSPGGMRRACEKLRSFQFDVSIDTQGNTKSAFAGRLSGASQRIGYAGRHGRGLGQRLNNIKVTPVFRHVTDRALELLTPLQIHSPAVRWDLPVHQVARAWAQRWRRSNSSNRLAILNPGGTWPSKLWEPGRFAATADYLQDRYGYQSAAIWGTDEERRMAERIVQRSRGSVVLAPQTDLYHLAALLDTADLFISGDTGPLHIAVAVGTETIGLYGATRPGDSGPYGQVALQKAYQGGSRRSRMHANNNAMRAITVDHVCRAIDEIESKRQFMRAAA